MAVVDGVADAVREVHAVPQALLPVVHVVDRLTARPDIAALVNGGEVARGERTRLDALQFRGQLAEQWVHLLGVAGALGLELAGELALFLGPLDDRVDLIRRSADHRLRRRGVHAHLEIGIVGEHRLDLVCGVLDERHQPDVLAEQHRLALAHQVRARADGAGGVGERQAAGEVGGGSLAERLANHCTGFRPVMLEQLAERDLDREDGDLSGLDAVVLRVVEDQLDDRVPELVLDQRVDLVDPLREDLVAQIQALGHLAVLGAETGKHPHRPVGDGAVGAVHVRALLAVGECAQGLDRLVVVVRHHHGARPAVVAPRQRAADRLQRGGAAFLGVHPVGQLGGRGLLA